jgi:CheY-like chemotaxis protein
MNAPIPSEDMSSILIATAPISLDKVKDLFGSSNGFRITTTEADAKEQILSGSIDLIILGMHFDDCKSIDFLNFVKSREESRDTPMVYMRISGTALSAPLRECVVVAVSQLGATDYIDIPKLEETLSLGEVRKHVRRVINNALKGMNRRAAR